MFSKEIFTAALHISSPWLIRSVNLDPDQKRLDVEIDFERDSEFTIEGEFETFSGKAYDTKLQVWQHLNFFEYKCYLNTQVSRIKSPDGQTHSVKTPWEDKMNGFTILD